MTAESPEPKSRCIAIGQALLAACLMCLIAGGAIVKIFFPHMRGRGLTPEFLYILIPIWSLGVVGLLLLAIGWIANPAIAPRLQLPRRSDGRYCTPFVKALGAFTSGLLCLAFLVGLAVGDTLSLSARLIVYCMFSMSAFAFYLATFYSERRDVVVTTYLNVFLYFFAVLLVPLTWPLLVFFRSAAARKRAFEAAWNGDRRPLAS